MFPSAKELSKMNDKILQRQNTTNTLLCIIARALAEDVPNQKIRGDLIESVQDTIKVVQEQVKSV